MARLNISRWIDGINTRLNKFRIGESEAVEATDVDLSSAELRSEKGIDTNSTAGGDYKFKGN